MLRSPSDACAPPIESPGDTLIIENLPSAPSLLRKALENGMPSSLWRRRARLVLSAAVFSGPCLFAGAQSQRAENAVVVLDHGWQFRQVSATPQDTESGWMPATVPGDVHLDLLANKNIQDPFFRDNESKLQWIENASWEYRDTFDVPAGTVRGRMSIWSSTALTGSAGLSERHRDPGCRRYVPDLADAGEERTCTRGKNLLRVVFPSPISAPSGWRRPIPGSRRPGRSQDLHPQSRL